MVGYTEVIPKRGLGSMQERSFWISVTQARPNNLCHLRGACVQLVYKKAVLKGLKLDLSNAESTTDAWATGSPCGSAQLARVWEANFAVKRRRING